MVSSGEFASVAQAVDDRYPGLGDVVRRCLVGWSDEYAIDSPVVYAGLMVKIGQWLDKDNGSLVEDVARLREDNSEYADLLGRLSLILTRTANALKGQPAPNAMHDWSDLPAVAAELVASLPGKRKIQSGSGRGSGVPPT